VIPGLALAALELELYAHDLDLEVAHQWITFGADGGAMVLGTALMTSFFIPKLAEHGLRRGLLSIGAAAFVDTFATWWAARSDTDAIPMRSRSQAGSRGRSGGRRCACDPGHREQLSRSLLAPREWRASSSREPRVARRGRRHADNHHRRP